MPPPPPPTSRTAGSDGASDSSRPTPAPCSAGSRTTSTTSPCVMTTTSPSSWPTNSYTTLPPLISISPSAMSLLVLCVREQLVLEREVERDAVDDALACEPLVGLLDRFLERAARAPSDVARE